MKPGESLTIVALPQKGDPVWDLSSEKVPHMTLLFLGDQSDNPNVDRILEYVEHASNHMKPFGLSVDRRGLLGDHDADVLFFEVGAQAEIRNFRSWLLAQGDIHEAYCSTKQYPSWTPHLTLGYPESPAKEDLNNPWDPSYVVFDRVAVWTGDYEGPEFPLGRSKVGGVETYMSDDLEDVLKHYGILGMKWGRRKSSSADGPETVVVTQKKPGSKLTAKGGRGHSADEDAVKAVGAAQKVKKSGLQSLSNKELQTLVTRMNLEQQFVNLKSKEPSRFATGQAALKKVLGLGKTLQEVHSLANSPAGKDLAKLIKKK